MIEQNETFASHDVDSLFTNTPIQKSMLIIRDRLEQDDRTKLCVDDVMELLEFVHTTTYFSFRGEVYQQKFGTAMGSPVSPIVANLFMEFLEQLVSYVRHIDKKTSCQPDLDLVDIKFG